MLQQQGFGTRKECKKLVDFGCVTFGGEEAPEPGDRIRVWEGMPFEVQGEGWSYRERVVVLLHKPGGFECTQKMGVHPTVFELLPWQIQGRGAQCVGRLDQDTTGLLLLTDDGSLNHALTSPKRRKMKVYEVDCKHEVTDEAIDRLNEGVRLKDAPEVLVRAHGARRLSEKRIEMAVGEGKYHQVKRMVGAVGNRVEGLHRSRVCGLSLPGDLGEGEWRYLSTEEVQELLIDRDE